jgi:TPR repeat protein
MQPQIISVEAAIHITERSRSTWWRRMSKGEVTRVADDARGRAMLQWVEVLPQLCVPLTPDDAALALLADTGNAEAQNDLGQLFLTAGKPKAAVYWFELAAAQHHPDAMQWLGHCHLYSQGVPQDDHLGLMWLAKAAAHGHVIAQELMNGLMRVELRAPAALK